jgi:periplasmic protein TonB
MVAGDPNGKETKKDSTPVIVAVNPNPGPVEPPTVLVPEVDPIPTCDIKSHIARNLDYPEMAKEAGVQGTVYVSFVVDENGNVTNTKVVKDIGFGCGDAALDAVKSLCKWKPGKMGGRSVRVLFNLPVKFKLR